MTCPANATPLERMLDAAAHLTTVANAVRDGVYSNEPGEACNALLEASAHLERARLIAVAPTYSPQPMSVDKLVNDAFEMGKYGDDDLSEIKANLQAQLDERLIDGMRLASRVVAGSSTPPSSPGIALALANFRAVLVCDLEGRVARREVTL